MSWHGVLTCVPSLTCVAAQRREREKEREREKAPGSLATHTQPHTPTCPAYVLLVVCVGSVARCCCCHLTIVVVVWKIRASNRRKGFFAGCLRNMGVQQEQCQSESGGGGGGRRCRLSLGHRQRQRRLAVLAGGGARGGRATHTIT